MPIPIAIHCPVHGTFYISNFNQSIWHPESFLSQNVREVLAKGNIAGATARNPSKLSFDGTNSKNYLAVALDVTDELSIEKMFKATIDTFGRVDVVVNNTWYDLSGVF